MTIDLKLLVDFGSTYTKAVLVDLKTGSVVSRSQARSTVKEDVKIGFREAIGNLRIKKGEHLAESKEYLASSSAAGGLKMVCSGFVPELTSEAAKRVALGAGAKVVATFSHKVTRLDIEKIRELAPDIILLAGGTDGGNSEVIVHNARALANAANLNTQILAAGNKDAGDTIIRIFASVGKNVILAENVLPDIEKINPEPCNREIRELFISHIVKAKGIEEDVLMPTPSAVLEAAMLLAEGSSEEDGLGDLIVVDVGGATADVISIGVQRAHRANAIIRGLPEPYAKRTVEGDLGVRYGTDKILEILSAKVQTPDNQLVKYAKKVFGRQILPIDDLENMLDSELAYVALKEAVKRHVGRIELVYGPLGEMDFQYGKDLTKINFVIGTGGPIVFSKKPRKIMEGALFDTNKPEYLRPKKPRFFIDQNYVLFAAGLLKNGFPRQAFKLIKKNLREV
jgi:uncharacterized protein (TIGR01319 family)